MFPKPLFIVLAIAMAVFILPLANQTIALAQDDAPEATSVLVEYHADTDVVSGLKIALAEWIEAENEKPLFKRDRAKIRKLTRALRNDALLERVAIKYEPQIRQLLGDDGGEPGDEGRFLKILEWFIANQDEILRFIMAIMDLFSWSNPSGGHFHWLAMRPFVGNWLT